MTDADTMPVSRGFLRGILMGGSGQVRPEEAMLNQ